MKVINISFYFLLIVFSCQSQEIDNREEQIEQAIAAAAEKDKLDCTVYGYDNKGELIILRKGSNQLICLADDPNKNGYNVACYHTDLNEFMARGRQLKKEGKSAKEIFDIRENEVKQGKLKMPDKSTLSVLSGKIDEKTGKPLDLKLRYVVYLPFATSESTGLPLAPVVNGGPWIMNPGTHRAHIMINPQ